MFIAVIIWASIVTNLATTTKIRNDCMKENKCEIEVKEIGYRIK